MNIKINFNSDPPLNKDRLIVYFQDKDNTVIGKDYYVTDVFEKAIEKINPLLIYTKGNVICDDELLILNRQHSKYPEASRKLSNGFYLNTHSSTKRKKELLEKISDNLKLGLRVVLIEEKD